MQFNTMVYFFHSTGYAGESQPWCLRFYMKKRPALGRLLLSFPLVFSTKMVYHEESQRQGKGGAAYEAPEQKR